MCAWPLSLGQCFECVWHGEGKAGEKGRGPSSFIPGPPLSPSLNKHLVCPPTVALKAYTPPLAPPGLRTGQTCTGSLAAPQSSVGNAKAGRCHPRPVDGTAQRRGQMYLHPTVAQNTASSAHHPRLPGAIQWGQSTMGPLIWEMFAQEEFPEAARKALELRVKWNESSGAPSSLPASAIDQAECREPAVSQAKSPPSPRRGIWRRQRKL